MYKDDFFDFCFSYISFHHIAEFEAIANYIREINRVLKPGGMFMFQVNTSKWVIKAGGWLPIHYRVRDFLSKIGVLNWYARIKTKDSFKATFMPKTHPIYYTSPTKLDKVIHNTTLDILKINDKNKRYSWYCGKKKPLLL